MPSSRWDDYRIAYQVAISGSLTKAGAALEMNHATVLRHINQLEDCLKTKLFIRHQRGYQLTDAGKLLVAEFPSLAHQFTMLEEKLCGTEREVSGNLRVTTVPDHPPLLNHAFKAFLQAYPKLRIQIIATDEILSLAGGEAHVSIRAGKKPSEPDLIVKKLSSLSIRYYASHSYIKQHGMPKTNAEFRQHWWVMPSTEKRHIPYIKSILQHIDEENIVYQSNNFPDIACAVAEGMGIGPMTDYKAREFKQVELVETFDRPPKDSFWFVYHKDLKSSARIQALYKFLTQQVIDGVKKEN